MSDLNFLTAEAAIVSTDGGEAVRLEISNNTSKTVTLSWIDRSGVQQFYADIAPGKKHNQSTYASHAWQLKSIDSSVFIKFLASSSGKIIIGTDLSPEFFPHYERIVSTELGLWSSAQGYGLIDVAKSLGVSDVIALPTNGQSNNLALNSVKAPAAWAAGYTGKGVKVAVIDAGIGSHAEIAGKIVGGFDFAEDDADPTPDSGTYKSHALGVAAIISASHDPINGIDTKGVAPDATLLNVRVGTSQGSQSELIAKGIRYAVEQGAKVICIPLQSDNQSFSKVVADAVHEAYLKNVIVAIIGGNFGSFGPTGPALIGKELKGEAIVVGNFNVMSGSLFKSSNMPGSDPFPWVVASSSGYVPNVDGGYSYWDDGGTSFAGPYVAGLAALLLQQSPNATAKEIIDKIIAGASIAGNKATVAYLAASGISFGQAIGLVGGTADDRLIGGLNDDVLEGGGGNDYFDGGDGNDVAVYNAKAAETVLTWSRDSWKINAGSSFGVDTLKNIETLSFSDRTVQIAQAAHASYSSISDDLWFFFLAAFNGAPGVTYMDWMVDRTGNGKSIKSFVDVFVTAPQFKDVYPESMSSQEFATKLVANTLKGTAAAVYEQAAVDKILNLMSSGATRSDVIYNAIGDMKWVSASSPIWGKTAQLFEKQKQVAKFYTDIMSQSTTDAATLRSVVANVSYDTDLSTEAKIIDLIGVSLLGNFDVLG